MPLSYGRYPVAAVGVDWITCTAKRGVRGTELCNYADAILRQEENSGEKVEDWRFQGYHGSHCGQVSWGWGKDGGIVTMSQEASTACAHTLANLADHWSRIDYAVTIFDTTGFLSPPEDYWQIYKAHYGNTNPPVSLGRIQQFGAGSTVTLGRRTSASYVRCYDKFEESKGDWAKGSWRYELELKREQSEAQQLRWKENVVFESYQSGLVKGFLEAHHLPAPWDENATLEPCHHLRRTRQADRTLNWLASQVQPSVEWVAQARGEEAVKKALHLT